MPRLITSSVSSLTVQWVIGRPDFSGSSQATAKIWVTCSGVNLAGAPGRAFAHRLGRDQLGTGHRHLGPAILARPQRGQPGPEEKESDQWINGMDASRAVLYQAAGERPVPRLIHVMDREGDAYEVMMTVADAGDSAIIRCAQNRKIDDPLAKAHEGRGCGASRSCAGPWLR